jgi:hypothetical protein
MTRELSEQSASVPLMTDEEFVAMCLDGQQRLKLSDSEIADSLRVSRPCWLRWKRGVNLPYKGIRNSIKRWFDER